VSGVCTPRNLPSVRPSYNSTPFPRQISNLHFIFHISHFTFHISHYTRPSSVVSRHPPPTNSPLASWSPADQPAKSGARSCVHLSVSPWPGSRAAELAKFAQTLSQLSHWSLCPTRQDDPETNMDNQPGRDVLTKFSAPTSDRSSRPRRRTMLFRSSRRGGGGALSPLEVKHAVSHSCAISKTKFIMINSHRYTPSVC
jgi:hypothetical protein